MTATFDCSNPQMLPVPSFCRDQYDDTPLGNAMRVCDRHRDYSRLTNPPSVSFHAAWEACYKVHQAWKDSETMKRRRAAEEQDEHDRQMIIEFAKGLK